jgi:hypothetical protein
MKKAALGEPSGGAIGWRVGQPYWAGVRAEISCRRVCTLRTELISCLGGEDFI